MGKTLVIVESPAKANTIGRYLGKEYVIKASKGHIRDLPQKVMGVNTKNNYKPQYIDSPDKAAVIREIKELAAKCDNVLIATDPDREGEAIAWHIATVLKIDPSTKCRITFNEITKKAVQKAVSEPREIDLNVVDAQQARRVLDRLCGYELSPLLWRKIHKDLSAGRVQSVATKLVMERDDEIAAFEPKEYWEIVSSVSHEGTKLKKDRFDIEYYGESEEESVRKVTLNNADEANAVVDDVKGSNFTVSKVTKGEKERNSAAPFTTSTLQQEASRRLGFAPARTMNVAQMLYQGVNIADQGSVALISYMRTDSVRISDEAVAAARDLIMKKYGKDYLCPYKREFKNKNSAQDAHEAIRPTHFDLEPDVVKSSLTGDQYKLYKLIWERFIATQMSGARLDTMTADIVNGGHVFKVSGEVVTFDGFLKLYDDLRETGGDSKKKETVLPVINEGDVLVNHSTDAVQKFTQPKPHYTEATLISTMEKNGIGRPSTYAPTISTIEKRNYVDKEGKSIIITDIGRLVTVFLQEHFEEFMDVGFTADMEEKLDSIESGDASWVDIIDGFYPKFHDQIEEVGRNAEKITIEDEKTGEMCPECGSELVFKNSRYGRFIACSNYPDCKFSKNIEVKLKDTPCPYCGSEINILKSKKHKNKTFYACDRKGSDPDCQFISWDPPVKDKKCPTCGSFMVYKKFRGKTYQKCGNRECPSNEKRKKT
ncbi:DNA topoisomerase-1 [Ruminococcaceae bacterium YRB3002]|nr:DNA topoisomerase-1 [Ruminococcaceae bacterium YRB3002]